MTEPTSTGVTRHLNYAWVEFGHSGDGQAFSVGLDKLGWKNLVRYLPRKRDSKGSHYVDSGHPLLPIRWKGRCRMILPNAVKDTKKHPKPFVDDPLFEAHRDANGEDAFKKEVRSTTDFLSRWVFSPGIKGDPTSEGELTLGAGATDYADLVACSGHGSSGIVWGGEYHLGCHIANALKTHGAATSSDRLKYVLIPTCYNLHWYVRFPWLPALQRANPVHGVLGYADSYPGGEPGREIFRRFAKNLAKDGGRLPILDAYRQAHPGWLAKRWGAIIHASSRNDTMRDWLAGKLVTPAPSGELRWYCDGNWPDGQVVTTTAPAYTVSYVVDGTPIDFDNHHDEDVGLFAGGSGHIQIKKRSGTFAPTDRLVLIFYYYRPEKDGMDLDRLLTVSSTPTASVATLTDENKRDGTHNVDALEIRPTRAGLASIDLPFTVHGGAPKHFGASGGQNAYGYFWMKLMVAGEEYPHLLDGAWLRKARS